MDERNACLRRSTKHPSNPVLFIQSEKVTKHHVIDDFAGSP
jgi:hypothetical protein